MEEKIVQMGVRSFTVVFFTVALASLLYSGFFLLMLLIWGASSSSQMNIFLTILCAGGVFSLVSAIGLLGKHKWSRNTAVITLLLVLIIISQFSYGVLTRSSAFYEDYITSTVLLSLCALLFVAYCLFGIYLFAFNKSVKALFEVKA